MARDIVYSAKLDISDLVAKVQQAINELTKARNAYRQLTEGPIPSSTTAMERGLIEPARRARQEIFKVNRQLQELRGWQARLAQQGGFSLRLPGSVMGQDRPSTFAGQPAMEQRRLDLEAKREELVQRIIGQEELARRASLQWQQKELNVLQSRHLIEQQISQIISGRFQQDLLAKRLQGIDAAIAKYQELKAAQQEGILGPLQSRTGRKVGQEERTAQKELNAAKREEARLEALIAENSRKSQGIKDQSRRATLAAQHQELINEQQIAKAATAGAQKRLEAASARRLGADTAAGQAGVIAGFDQQIAQLQQLRQDAIQGATFGTPEQNQKIGAYRNELTLLQNRLKLLTEGTEQYIATQRRMGELTTKIQDLGSAAAREGIPDVPTVEQSLAQQQAGFTRMQRVMAGAFDGFQRRFEATLQFAISGALIFGVQRMVREFIESAIEVERAFKDIETALEFDVGAGIERGSVEFNKIVRDMRLEVLSIANDFNVLPAEANKAAFVMVSRFDDSANAMKAFRAQILATKVSGIDQTEVLRALTAVAEGFAGAIFEANDALTIQEKLLKRETIAAELYAQALDLAVYIQQKFGVETEDVLEGTARATEVFRQMGFDLVETSALVSAVSRQLGQTGQSSAERLVRSIGQLTSGEIKGELLELAEASDAFTLSLEDFATGATAWQAIVAQFQKVEIGDPKVAQEILQIIGQRREAEAVAAALGTTDLQAAIIAAGDQAIGAAERRFGFLADTVDEKIKSIAARFDELAQNVERIGALTPIKAGLEALENLLLVVNNIVQAFEAMANAIDGIPLVGELISSETVKNIASMAIALKSLQKVLYAAISTSGVFKLLGTAAKTAATGVVGGAVTGGAANPGLAPIVTAAALYKGANARVVKALGDQEATVRSSASALASWLGELLRVKFATLTLAAAQLRAAQATNVGALSRSWAFLRRATGRATGALLKFAPAVTAAVVLGTTFYALRKAGEEAAETLKDIGAERRVNALEAEREAIAGDLSPAEQERIRLQDDLESLERTMRDAGGELNRFHTGLLDLFGTWFSPSTVEFFTGEGTYAPGADNFAESLPEGTTPAEAERLFKELINKSPEWYEAEFARIRAALAEVGLQVMQEELSGIAPFEDFDAEERRRRLVNKLNFAETQLAGATTTEDRQAIAALIAEYEAELAVLAILNKQVTDALEGTIAGITKDLEQSNRDLSLGRISLEQAIADRQAAAAALNDLAGRYAIAGDQESADEAARAADDALKSALDGQIQVIENVVNRSEFAVTEMGRLNIEIAAAKQKMEVYEKYSEEWWDADAELRDLQRQKAQLEREQANQALQDQIATSRDQQETLDLRKQYVQQLFVQSIAQALSGDTDAARESTRQWYQEYYSLIDDQLDSDRRTLEARARLAGPINNKINQIQGQIDSVRKLLASDVSGADRLEANVQLQELLAELNNEQTVIWAAQVLAIAGVNDTITNLNAQLTINARQQEVVAATIGENSQEWHDLDLAQQRLENQLALAELELDVIGARLDSDLTDPLAQASINLAEIIAKLANPDLGELERARLELERANAENREEQALFNAELFNLRFLSETGQLGTGAYITALQGLLSQVDTTTHQGKEIFLQIQGLIDGLTNDISNLQFNIPGSIRLPTLFEVRRAMEADSLGVNYMDNRTQTFTFYVSETVDIDKVVDAVNGSDNNAMQRTAPGAATMAFGGSF